jgi:hypothetical protein
MSERFIKKMPVELDGALVQAVLSGKKTTIRRPLHPQPGYRWNVAPDGTACRNEHEKHEPCEYEPLKCPVGGLGDQLSLIHI